MGMTVRISSALLANILAHAAVDPAREACGLLFGAADEIVAISPAANLAADTAIAFEIDPAALFAAIRAERTGGPRLIGHYHSHPNGDASPSVRDAAAANLPGRLWLITAAGRAACFREEPGGPVHHAFRPVSLVVSGVAACIPGPRPPERPFSPPQGYST